MIMMLLLPFQTLLKEKEVTEDIHTRAAPGGHPEGAVDLDVLKIAH
jgi:hypothetical protein